MKMSLRELFSEKLTKQIESGGHCQTAFRFEIGCIGILLNLIFLNPNCHLWLTKPTTSFIAQKKTSRNFRDVSIMD